MKKEQNKRYNAACYGRLSKEDGKLGVSESIETQMLVMREFCENNGIYAYTFYCDDDYTGINFNRPDFEQMIEALQMGKHNMLVVKDLSRFGRDSGDVLNYIEKYFPSKDIRVVSLGEHYDSVGAKDPLNFELHFKALLNEMYVADASQKTRLALHAKARAGEFLGSKAPYGYEKSAKDKHKLIIDAEAAKVVKRIFQMATAEGYGYQRIARALKEGKILTPTAYQCKKEGKPFPKKDPYDWNLGSVKAIIDNEAYYGDLVSGKREVLSYKCKKVVANDPKDWTVVKGIIPPIVTKEIWEDAHARVQVRKRKTESGFVNIFAGLLYCDTCGHALGLSSAKDKDVYYACEVYKKKGRAVCTSHRTFFTELYDAVLQDVRTVAYRVCAKGFDMEAFSTDIMAETAKKLKTKSKETIESLQAEIDKIDARFERMYEDRLDGIISAERFAEQTAKNEERKAELQQKQETLKARQQDEKAEREAMQRFIENVRRFGKIEVLTKELLNTLIEKITVGERTKTEAGYTQSINVYYKFKNT